MKVLFGDADGLAGAAEERFDQPSTMSSSNPSVTRELGPKLEALGVGFIDAPVSGGVKRAVDGSLAIMAGGDHAMIERVKPLLLTMANRSIRNRDAGLRARDEGAQQLCLGGGTAGGPARR